MFDCGDKPIAFEIDGSERATLWRPYVPSFPPREDDEGRIWMPSSSSAMKHLLTELNAATVVFLRTFSQKESHNLHILNPTVVVQHGRNVG